MKTRTFNIDTQFVQNSLKKITQVVMRFYMLKGEKVRPIINIIFNNPNMINFYTFVYIDIHGRARKIDRKITKKVKNRIKINLSQSLTK